jgi:hypothetical protein
MVELLVVMVIPSLLSSSKKAISYVGESALRIVIILYYIGSYD